MAIPPQPASVPLAPQLVHVGEHRLQRYLPIIGEEAIGRIRELARCLDGLRVCHISSTPFGGGVSELLRSLVPLQRDVGIDAEWRVISASQEFFDVTKRIHNGLQGAPGTLTDRERSCYLTTLCDNAVALGGGPWDVIIAHDPQTAALASLAPDEASRWVWRCHVDTGSPARTYWEFVEPLLDAYDGIVFTMREFVPPGLEASELFMIPPAIDPLSPKNLPLDDALVSDVLGWIGIDPDEQLVTQVSRFDPWKDPLGVLSAFNMVRGDHPGLQLVFAGSMALDDPEGWRVYRELEAAARGDHAVHVFTNLSGIGNIEVNALQRRSRVVVQKSIREGFGLVVSESLWKHTPVVAGRAGGIQLQMADGVGGLLVDDIRGCADAIDELLTRPEYARQLADAGYERVREHFLMPRLLLSELVMLTQLTQHPAAPAGPVIDPECGLVVADPERWVVTINDVRMSFCSQRCRDRYLEA